MAYFNQEMKKERANDVKAVLKKYNVKGTLSVSNHSTFVVTLKEGAVDFGTTREQVNTYWIERNYEDNPTAREFLLELKEAMMTGNYDRSDVQTDYFDVGFYVSINIGAYGKPYKVV